MITLEYERLCVQTMDDKVNCQEGNSPDYKLRFQKGYTKRKIVEYENNNKIGLEAAILDKRIKA